MSGKFDAVKGAATSFRSCMDSRLFAMLADNNCLNAFGVRINNVSRVTF
jgi:hypothetical protein